MNECDPTGKLTDNSDRPLSIIMKAPGVGAFFKADGVGAIAADDFLLQSLNSEVNSEYDKKTVHQQDQSRAWNIDPQHDQHSYIALLDYDDLARSPQTFGRCRFYQVKSWKLIQAQDLPPPSSWTLLPKDDRSIYISKCQHVISEILQGRYYQLNFLRFFDAIGEEAPEKVLSLMSERGGPFSAWIEDGDQTLLSLSPEEFVRVYPDADGQWIECFPIKGTRPRSAVIEDDLRYKLELEGSEKDARELQMIVDLMRNDFYRLCHWTSVEVLDPGSVFAFESVYHRIAHIRGQLKGSLTIKDMIAALLPAGSITGAPKTEVIKAISEIEERPRHYFMGNILFYSPKRQFLQSSVLIRTLHRQENRWSYAAGGGIVLGSEPALEFDETETKCQLLR